MTNPGDQFPTPPGGNEPLAPTDIDAYYKAAQEGRQYIAGLIQAGHSPEIIEGRIDEGGPMARQAWEAQQVAQDFYAEANRYGPRIFGIVAKSRVKEVNPLADELSDLFIERLGRSPNLFEVQDATLMLSFATALATSHSHKPVPFDMESGFVNQFTNALIAKMDSALLSRTFAHNSGHKGSEERALAIARGASAGYGQMTGRYISDHFLASKIAYLWYATTNALTLHAMRAEIAQPGEHANIEEMRRTNTEFAEYIRHVRAYGVKPTIFTFSDVIRGQDVVYHEFSKLDFAVKGEQPLVLATIVPAETPNVEKIQLTTEEAEGVRGALKIMRTPGGTLSLDHNGDIYCGHSPATSSMSLKTLFERNGDAAKYEELRAALLSRLFDAVAPAEIVDRIDQPRPRPGAGASAPPEHVPASPVRRLVLPRLRYFNSMQSVRQLKEEFNEALRTEQAINAREAAYRHIAAHLRNLPASARRASDDAIQRAKEAYGDDFQIPEGKTFVRDYEYGNPTAGEVIGYVAVRRAAGGGKGKGKGGGRKK